MKKPIVTNLNQYLRCLSLNRRNANFVVPQQPTRPGSKAANSKRAKKKNSNSSMAAAAANGGGKAVEANLAAASSTPHKVITKISLSELAFSELTF